MAKNDDVQMKRMPHEGKRILQLSMASFSGTLISAQTAVWFGKLVLSRQTRYWYQRGHGGAPGVLRFALRQWYTCEPAASILSASDRKVAHGRYFILPHRTLLCDPQATSLMLRSSSPSSEGGKDSNMVDELTIHDCDQVSFTIVWCPLWIQFRVYCKSATSRFCLIVHSVCIFQDSIASRCWLFN